MTLRRIVLEVDDAKILAVATEIGGCEELTGINYYLMPPEHQFGANGLSLTEMLSKNGIRVISDTGIKPTIWDRIRGTK
jgi:hypothetical protein